MSVESQQSHQPITKKKLMSWAFRKNLKLQLLLLLVISVMVATRVIPLEMQKRIVNDAIVLKKIDSLLLYCGIYLLAVTITGASKLVVNYLQARIGEDAMLAMRKELYSHIVSLPLLFFRNTQPGVVVTGLMTELASAGTFAGMALAVPLSNILTLLAFAGYLLWLNPQLALITLSIYPIVVILIPYLQKKANRFNKKRVDQSRLVASQITESITGIHEINVHAAHTHEKQKFNRLVEQLRTIRLKWSLFRFSIKTANNYFIGLGPFAVFIFGGYLVMQGQLELGSMVAFLSAQEKLYDPWKQLIEFYQVYQDASVRYKRTMKIFDIPVTESSPEKENKPVPINGTVQLTDAGYALAEGKTILQQVSFTLLPGKHLALVGFSGSGKSTLVQCIGKMLPYTNGSIKIDGAEIKDIDKRELVKQVGYISQHPFIFSGSVLDNLIYAHGAAYDQPTEEKNTYQSPPLDHLILCLQQAGFFVDIIRFGLETSFEQSTSTISSKIITMRENFKKTLEPDISQFIEFYDPNTYLQYSTVLENITFSVSRSPDSAIDQLLAKPTFHTFLRNHNLFDMLLRLGKQIAKESVELQFSSQDDNTQLNFLPLLAGEPSEYVTLINKIDASSKSDLSPDEEHLFLKPALLYIPGIHSSIVIPTGLDDTILSARSSWRRIIDNNEYAGILAPLKSNQAISGRSVLDNILYGKIKTEETIPNEKISQAIIRLLIEEDCLEDVADAGMLHNVGNMGDNLSGGQRQKLAIARVLLKEPKVVLMDEATSALDNKSQTRIQRLLERWKGEKTVIAVVHRLDTIQNFDFIGVMKSGKLVEYGPYEDLMGQKNQLYELVTGKRG